MNAETDEPGLSVVVALISGKKGDLDRCLAALDPQGAAQEIIVPWDEPCADVTQLASKYPRVRFLFADDLDTAAARAGDSREHHDTLRTIGLRAARGRAVALTEDHAVASDTWCADMLRLLDEHPQVGAIGGAVDCRSEKLLNHAVYYCDFGRYQNPLPEGPATYVSDSNVAYRREALSAVADAWKDDYHETMVHWALAEAGYELWLTPASQVWQARTGLTLGSALNERYVWGRSFAGTRARGVPATKRLVYLAFSFVLPFLLTARIVRGALARKRGLGRFLFALPIVFLLQAVWAWGEFVGYLTKDPGEA